MCLSQTARRIIGELRFARPFGRSTRTHATSSPPMGSWSTSLGRGDQSARELANPMLVSSRATTKRNTTMNKNKKQKERELSSKFTKPIRVIVLNTSGLSAETISKLESGVLYVGNWEEDESFFVELQNTRKEIVRIFPERIGRYFEVGHPISKPAKVVVT